MLLFLIKSGFRLFKGVVELADLLLVILLSYKLLLELSLTLIEISPCVEHSFIGILGYTDNFLV